MNTVFDLINDFKRSQLESRVHEIKRELLTKQKIKKGKEISSKQIKEVKLPMFMMKIIIKKMKIIFIIESEIKK